MDAGRLTQRVELHRRDFGSSATGTGALLENWTLVAVVWAQVEPSSGSETFAAAAARTASTLSRFRMRYRSDLDQSWRLRWRGDWFDVVEILPGGQQLREWLDVAASASAAENAET